jgi:iron complex outermembrane receptor protein
VFKIFLLSPSICLLSFYCIAEGQDTLEVIEIAAQKRLQNIKEVAISVTSLNQQKLQDNNIQDSYQLNGLSPNVLITENAGSGSPPAVTIRGVGLIDYNTSNTSPISFYFDEAVNGSVNSQFAEMFDIQRVEILRGPQGTLFGRNTSGGAILFFSQPPEQEFSAYAKAGVGSDAYQKIEAMLNLPLTSNSATRLTVQHVDYDFSATNNLTPAPQEGIKRQSLRWQYALNTESLKLNLKLSAADWSGISQPYGHTGVLDLVNGKICSANDASRGLCTDAFGFSDGSNEFRDVAVDNTSPHETEQFGLRLKLDWKLNDDFSITSISAYNNLDRQHQIHCDASSLNVCVGFFGLDDKTYSQELRVNGQSSGFSWIAGLFLFEEQIYQQNSIDLLRDFRIAGASSGAAQYFYNNIIDTKSKAMFGQTDIHITSRTSLTLGLRYTHEQLSFVSDTDRNTPTSDSIEGVTALEWSVEDQQKNSQWSGKLALNHKLSNDWMLYASASNGFKSGGFNGGFLFAEEEAKNAAYGPEMLYSYEVGSKADLWNKQARVAVSAFYYDYRNQQVFINQPSSTSDAPNLQLLQNIPNSTIFGVESEFEWQITSDLNVNLSAGYIPTAKFGNYIDPTGKLLTNNRQPFTPKFQISSGVGYRYDIETSGYLMLNVLARYQTIIYFDQNQSSFTQQPTYTLWDTSLTYYSPHIDWNMTLNIKNVFDTEYDTLRFDLRGFLGLVNSNKGEARRVFLEFNYAFD